MKIRYSFALIALGIVSTSDAMEKPQTPNKIGLGQAPSLKTIIIEQQLKNVKSVKDLEKMLDTIQPDLRCELIKAVIKTNKFITLTSVGARDLYLRLINTYCSPDPQRLAIMAYAIYKTLSYENVENSFMQLYAIKEEAIKNSDNLGLHVTQDIDPKFRPNPLSVALANKHSDAIQFFIAMGEKPTTQDLTHAIKNNDTQLAILLINSGVQADNPHAAINEQPLFYAAISANETIIDLLIEAGASFNKQYTFSVYSPEPIEIPAKSDNIAGLLRSYLNSWLVQPENERHIPAGETVQSLERKYRKVLELLDTYEKIEQQKKAMAIS